jgi:hypothetical protein
MSKEIPVKLSRVIHLFGIVSASIIALAILFIAFLVVQPTFEAIGWHLRHGNKVVFDGHTFHVPLMWHCTSEPYRNALEIDHKTGAGNIELISTGQVLDSAAAHAWQAKTIIDQNNFNKGSSFKKSGQIIAGKNLEFVCVSTDSDLPYHVDMLDCRISNTDLTASIASIDRLHPEVESILVTSK